MLSYDKARYATESFVVALQSKRNWVSFEALFLLFFKKGGTLITLTDELKCNCENSNVECTVVSDPDTGLVIVEAMCLNCGKLAHAWGYSADDALTEVHKEWKKAIRHRRGK